MLTGPGFSILIRFLIPNSQVFPIPNPREAIPINPGSKTKKRVDSDSISLEKMHYTLFLIEFVSLRIKKSPFCFNLFLFLGIKKCLKLTTNMMWLWSMNTNLRRVVMKRP